MSNGDASHEAPAADFQEGAVGNPTINKERRYFLIGATSAVAGLGVVGAAVPFVRFWNPSAKARALGAPVKIDISKLKPGEMLSPMPAWRGRPIFIVYRDADVVSVLESSELNLADPESDNADMQPEYARNPTRSTSLKLVFMLGYARTWVVRRNMWRWSRPRILAEDRAVSSAPVMGLDLILQVELAQVFRHRITSRFRRIATRATPWSSSAKRRGQPDAIS